MTISTETRKYRYDGDGVADTFAFDNRIFATSDLTVQLLTRATDAVVETLAETTDYTVTILSNGNASVEVTNVSKIPSASQDILLKAETPLTQANSLPTGTPFPAKTVENALDKVTVLVQEMQEQLDRGIKIPASSSTTADLELPTPEANKFFRWNDAADGLENVDIATLGGVAVGTSGDVVGKLNADKTDSGDNIYSGTSTHSDDVILSSAATRTLSILSDGNSRIQLGAVGAGVNDDWLIRKAAASSDLLEMRYNNVLKASLDASTGEFKAIGGINPNSSGGSILASFINPTVFAASLTGTANVSAASDTYSQYVRIGDLVIVWGRISVTATTAAGTSTTLEMTLPVTSALTDNAQVCGFCWNTSREAINGGVTGNASTDKANFSFSAQSTSARTIVYGFCYPVLT